MTESVSPLYFRAVACPACGAKGNQADFKSGMYVEEEREADQHVIRYRWLQPDVTPVHPPYFALAHCAECAFTDFREYFFEPARSRENRVDLIAPRLKAEVARRGSLISILRPHGTPATMDFGGALRLHLLAIAVQELLPDDRRDHLRIARLYLRAAWLYREQGETAQPTSVESEELAALDGFAARYRDLRAAADRLATAYAGRPPASQVAVALKQVESLGQGYADLRARLLSQGNGSSPLDFLTLARGEWPEIPTGEAGCLETSVRAFEQAYQRGDGESLALLKLMIELNYRLGQFDRVLEYVASISKTGHEERTKLQRQLADRSLSPEERTRLNTRINRIGATLQLASEIRQDALARRTPSSASAK
jgi:hypothetical protein